MLPKGLLVVDPHNQTFLLVPEERVETAGYTLSVLQLHNDQWVRLQPASSRKLRESMLGALLEFFGNLCRILNDSEDRTHRIKRIAPGNAPSAISQRPRAPAARMRRIGQQPGKTVSKQVRPLGPT
ncbi:MAG: hypothetical protein IT389_06945 [Nitrospira sp.]|nr:hypothetical protein [Nitrospira sp.]